MTGEEQRGKEEAGPSPIRASRVWAQDDSEKLQRKTKANVNATATANRNDNGYGYGRRPTLRIEGSGTRKIAP